MKWKTWFDEANNIFKVTPSGILTAETHAHLVQEIAVIINQFEYDRLLVTMFDIEMNLRTLDIYGIPEFYQSQKVSRKIRIALLVHEKDV